MKISDRPPGLIGRRMFTIDRGNVIVEEHWDISVPGCHLIRNQFVNTRLTGPKIVRQVEMSADDFKRRGIALF